MRHPRAIPVEPLTRKAFEPFGEVIETEGADSFLINDERTRRFHKLASLTLLGEGAKGIISIFRGDPPEPFEITLMERHPLGSQAFVPLNGGDFLAVVAPAGDFDESRVCAFLARNGQGLNYYAGTWHAPLLPVQPGSDYLVVDRAGPGNNCDEARLTAPLTPIFPGD